MDMKNALAKVSRKPRATGRKLIAENYDGIMELVGLGLSRADVYRRVSERIDLGMSESTFSTYMALEARKRRGK